MSAGPSTAEKVAEAAASGHPLRVAAGRLVAAGKPPPALLATLKACRLELVAHLLGCRPGDLRASPRGPAALEACPRPWQPRPESGCLSCDGSDWWQTRYGHWLCRACHPPAAPDLEADDLL